MAIETAGTSSLSTFLWVGLLLQGVNLCYESLCNIAEHVIKNSVLRPYIFRKLQPETQKSFKGIIVLKREMRLLKTLTHLRRRQ